MTRYSIQITLDRLLELLIFDPKTGFFTWKVTRAKAKAGSIAGCVGDAGYRWIGIDGQIYHAHRLVWLVVCGEWPKKGIDHIDLNGDNNIFSNLRLASDAQNQWNTAASKNNTSGHKGVFLHGNKWIVMVQKNKVRHYIGYFIDYHEACAAQETAAKKLHGQFYRS